MNLCFLDCTLRDGGYYNQWDFDPDIVRHYFRSIEAANIDAVEIGFRLSPQSQFVGAFGYCSEQFISSLPLPSCKIGVMLNAKDSTIVDRVFVDKNNSNIDFVRIASHFHQLDETCLASKVLKDMGYLVCVNLMQISMKESCEIQKAVEEIASWNSVDVLYFADSLGNLHSGDVTSIIQAIKNCWGGEIGIHAHNNKNLALQNTLSAISLGATWVDGTVLGMGRGSGNVRTEELAIELELNGHKYKSDELFSLVLEDFKQLQNEYKWGPNILYYLSAIYGIHPTYVQKMLENNQYSSSQLLLAMQHLRKYESSSFKKDTFAEAFQGDGAIEGTWSSSGWVEGQEVLVLASGSSVLNHKDEIIRFIVERKPFVVSLNCNAIISSKYIDVYAICHYSRLLTELDRYKTLDTPILMPLELLSEELKDKISTVILDYGISVKSGEFRADDSSCCVPSLIVAPYVFAAVTAGGASKMFLAGFDGFDSGDLRQQEMLEVLQGYRDNFSVPMISLTPTNYPVIHSSIYSWEYYCE